MIEDRVLGPSTKGLRLAAATSIAELVADAPPVTDDRFAWPLLTIDEAALEHNLATMARVCAERGALHAPHLKTSMSAGLYARQERAGAWGATVATATQLRVVRSWGVRRVLVANEMVDGRDWRWAVADLAAARAAGSPGELLAYVDGDEGLAAAAAALRDAAPQVRDDVGVLVELGVPGGRTGCRSVADAVALARRVVAAGVPLAGVAGYEGSVASGTTGDDLERVAAFCRELVSLADALVADGLVAEPVVSAGGSAYVDVVLRELTAGASPRRVVLRSGAYATHDHGLCARADPWARLPEPVAMRAAATVWCQVLSVPQDGLAICGAGRRDVPYDIDLPTVLSVRRREGAGWLDPEPASGMVVTKVDDQHLYLRVEAGASPAPRVGDVVGLGISHPCTLFDKWRAALLTDPAGRVVDVLLTEF
ncbi:MULTISPECIES: alanine racemase [unclassified Actinotalea]|uniref:alanine racemase n=1 Tax=unclassified Actinotalea TaxID=2638618 RepID=UPI0015F67CEF|nr:MULTISPECIES: alanine racemase [unclassified Actinotalea]